MSTASYGAFVACRATPMRITDVRLLLRHPARLVLLEVHTDEGIVGVGSTASPPLMVEAIINDPLDGLRQFVKIGRAHV